MSSTTQISAHISKSTKDRLERRIRATGVTRTHLIEQALLHHLEALEELPPDAITPPRIVLSRAGARRLAALVADPPPPTAAMKRLFDDR